MQHENVVERAKQIIAENIYMTIATSSLDGKPWISPVAFCYDNNYDLFWVSNKNALHSSLIRTNSRIAITIFDSHTEDGESDAVYFEAHASELENKADIEYAIKVLDRRPKKDDLRIKQPDQATGSKVWRIYKAVPTIVHKLVEGEHIAGQYVDKHVRISLTPST